MKTTNYKFLCCAAAVLTLPVLPPSTAGGLLDSRAEPRSARPLPVLMVIADQADFYYREYADTRDSIESAGLAVRVAATSTARSVPHPNTGQPAGTDGGVWPDLALSRVNPREYSAIVFVGGWGASQYQYAYNDPNFDRTLDNFYWHAPYNGDNDLTDGRISKSKFVVNNLVNEFLASDKHVAAICHGVTVLAWARVDGASPLHGRAVAVPFIGSPATFYLGQWYADYELGQYEQVVANGGIPLSTETGSLGDPTTAADDVVVDGRIITAENYDSAALFGAVVAKQVIAGRASSR
jgi:putative intracellular protease/amidase